MSMKSVLIAHVFHRRGIWSLGYCFRKGLCARRRHCAHRRWHRRTPASRRYNRSLGKPSVLLRPRRFGYWYGLPVSHIAFHDDPVIRSCAMFSSISSFRPMQPFAVALLLLRLLHCEVRTVLRLADAATHSAHGVLGGHEHDFPPFGSRPRQIRRTSSSVSGLRRGEINQFTLSPWGL